MREVFPITAKCFRFCSARVGDAVVASRAFARIDLPMAGHESALAKSIEERVDRALAGEQTAGCIEFSDELESEARSFTEQDEDARPDHPAPQLCTCTILYHVQNDIMRRKVTSSRSNQGAPNGLRVVVSPPPDHEVERQQP